MRWTCGLKVCRPMSSDLAIEPMAAKAGTASAILGLSQLGIGSVLAAAIDSRVGCTVTPMLVGGLVFGAAGPAIDRESVEQAFVGYLATLHAAGLPWGHASRHMIGLRSLDERC